MWADRMNSYKHFGMRMSDGQREEVHFEMMGTNYKLSNLLSAIGLAQLEKIEELLKQTYRTFSKLLKTSEKHQRGFNTFNQR